MWDSGTENTQISSPELDDKVDGDWDSETKEKPLSQGQGWSDSESGLRLSLTMLEWCLLIPTCPG